ncbi:MAG: hypothetical protein Q4A45_02460 [Clostridia bacterium]|nr:hypothetical protein [Clostridia bacterium]
MKSKMIKIMIFVIIIILMVSIIYIVITKQHQSKFIEEAFEKYMIITEDSKLKGEYSNYKDGYSFSVSEPKGLSLKGNLGISDENGNLLLIIKEYKKSDIICILLSDKNMEYPLIINEKGEMDNDLSYDSFQKELLDNNRETIYRLIDQYNLWQEASKDVNLKFFN